MNERTILHCDMNSFFASVELLSHPELRDKPTAVSGNPEHRHGIILAKNELAKKAGVKTAETIWQAMQKCPDLNLVKPHYEKYKHYYHLLNEIYGRYTDMVEPFSIDESWLDVTASRRLFGDGKTIADEIRETVKRELGLTLSVGVSFNKIFAKMGSDYKKPDATTVITKDNFKDIIWPLPIEDMFFVGRASAEKLKTLGIKTIGDAANYDEAVLVRLLGKQGSQIHINANGLDDTPVSRFGERQKIKSVGNGITFRRNIAGESDIRTAVTALSDSVAGRLRKYGLKAGGVKVDIKDPSFVTVSRQKKMDVPSNLASEISEVSMQIIKGLYGYEKAIRLITITAISLVDEDTEEQLSIFESRNEAHEKSAKIEGTMDAIRNKFGSGAISFGNIIGNDIGIELEDIKEE